MRGQPKTAYLAQMEFEAPLRILKQRKEHSFYEHTTTDNPVF